MEVSPGYKQTEVGVIPEDWDVKPLHTVLSKGRLGGNYPNHDTESEFPLMKMGNIARGRFDLSKVEFIVPGVTPESQHRLAYGDVLFNTRNTLELVGKVAIWRDELSLAYYNSNLMRLEFDANEVCSNEYANYQLNTAGSVARLRALATGTTSVAAIYTRDLMGLQFVVPSKPEQRAIAAALSDVDALLGRLERLIAKKRDLKQAAMQQLLTGQTRLPGFSGAWEVTSVDMLTSRATGVWGHNQPDDRNNRRADIIRAGDISQDGRLTATATRYVAPAEFEKAKCLLDDLVITTSGNGLGKIWWCDGRSDVAASNFVRVLHPIESKAVGRFLYYALRSGEGLRQLQEHTATSAYPNLRPTYFSTRWIPLPIPAEQTAIAAVLSDMDAELAALEARRDKTRDLKQAMMQELLTGRTRLVEPVPHRAAAC